MRLSSVSDLSDYMDEDLSWRKKELTTLLLQAKKETGSKHEQVFLRSGAVNLYAHWEGFIKVGARGYLNHVSIRRLPISRLKPNFISLWLSRRVKNFVETKDFNRFHLFVDQLLSNSLPHTEIFADRTAINTEGNLDSSVFSRIAIGLGLDIANYSSKAPLIDERLVAYRHKIAHGERCFIEREDYVEMHSVVMDLLNMFRDDIVNSAVLCTYLKS